MNLIIFSLFVATSFAALREPHVHPHFGGPVHPHFGGRSLGSTFHNSAPQHNGLAGRSFSGESSGGYAPPQPAQNRFIGGGLQRGFDGASSSFGSEEHSSCGEFQILSFDGHCVDAEVSSSIFLYSTPKLRSKLRSRPAFVPKPKLNYNVVFVRAPEEERVEPVIVPPPQQKTIVYVLSEGSESGEQQVIELPGGPSLKPEVFYVNYKEGENPNLSLGLNLEGALASAVRQEAKTVFSDSGEAGGHFGFNGDSRFGGHAQSSAEHSGFEGVHELHEGSEHSSDEEGVQRHHFSQRHHQQPPTAYGLPLHK